MPNSAATQGTFFVYSTLLITAMLAGGCQSRAAGPTDPSQTHTGGGVTIKATYINPGSGEGPRFLVTLETHSVDLDGYDLKNLSVLRDETGKTFLPTAVENEGAGHHRRVTIRFPKPAASAGSADLVILNVAGVAERVFHWDL